jgi:hypothetical protein
LREEVATISAAMASARKMAFCMVFSTVMQIERTLACVHAKTKPDQASAVTGQCTVVEIKHR